MKNITKGELRTCSIYDSVNDAVRRNVVRRDHYASFEHLNNQHLQSTSFRSKHSSLDIKSQGYALSPDEVLSELQQHQISIPVPGEAVTGQLPDSDLLHAIHYYVSYKIHNMGDPALEDQLVKALDETSLIAVGMLMEQWVRELIEGKENRDGVDEKGSTLGPGDENGAFLEYITDIGPGDETEQSVNNTNASSDDNGNSEEQPASTSSADIASPSSLSNDSPKVRDKTKAKAKQNNKKIQPSKVAKKLQPNKPNNKKKPRRPQKPKKASPKMPTIAVTGGSGSVGTSAALNSLKGPTAKKQKKKMKLKRQGVNSETKLARR